MTSEGLENVNRLRDRAHGVHLEMGARVCLGDLVLLGGTRNTLAPAPRTATVFWATPPTSPTVPSIDIVPVAATFSPPVRLAGSSSCMRPSVKAKPADGPTIPSEERSTFTGKGPILKAVPSTAMPPLPCG